ncbi:FAD-dependent oxidoreductase, partial [uncultured Methylobacterium sp.]|uniref:FAD-dependent oxidoreductase n=1 Tax=uncultured Methylobacterium sp. TaxID=157278 RepID=UPI00262DB9FF
MTREDGPPGGTAFDAVVAGAGIAGCAAAAALAEAGLTVLVVEPGQRAERRLSGELLHPPGLLGLKALGFVPPLAGREAAAIHGFCVFHDRGGGDAPTTLSYPGDAAAGLAMDHGTLRDALTGQLRGRAGVTLLEGARVTGLDLADPEAPVAVLRPGPEGSGGIAPDWWTPRALSREVF